MAKPYRIFELTARRRCALHPAECALRLRGGMSSLARLLAPLFAGLVLTACAGSTMVRGATNMQPEPASAAPAAAVSVPECKGGSEHCTGDSDCCSNLCIEQICSSPRN